MFKVIHLEVGRTKMSMYTINKNVSMESAESLVTNLKKFGGNFQNLRVKLHYLS